jgi:hypothetical protein
LNIKLGCSFVFSFKKQQIIPKFLFFKGASSTLLIPYDKNDIRVTLKAIADGKGSTPQQHFIELKAVNQSAFKTVKEFYFSVAVPKAMQMQLSVPNTKVIEPMDSLTQTIAISNPNKVSF